MAQANGSSGMRRDVLGAMLSPVEKLRHARNPRELFVARVTLLTIATVIIDLLASLAFFLLERDAAGTDVKNYEQAFFWTTSQLTTVSSSLQNPITTAGHAVAVIVDILAVGVVSSLIATVTHHLHLISPRRERYFEDSDSDDSRSKKSS